MMAVGHLEKLQMANYIDVIFTITDRITDLKEEDIYCDSPYIAEFIRGQIEAYECVLELIKELNNG